jgi:hypothetical protein
MSSTGSLSPKADYGLFVAGKLVNQGFWGMKSTVPSSKYGYGEVETGDFVIQNRNAWCANVNGTLMMELPAPTSRLALRQKKAPRGLRNGSAGDGVCPCKLRVATCI